MSILTTTNDAVAAPAAIERFYDAVSNGDVAGALGALDPDIVLHVPGRHPLAGDHHGTDGVLDFVVRSRELTVDGERIEVLDLLAGRSHVAALCRVTAERPDGRTLDNRTVHLMRTGADGRIVETWLHNADQHVVDAFWGLSYAAPIEFRAQADIGRSVDTVWSVMSDYRLDPQWRRGVERMDPEPVGPVVAGTTTREVLRLGGRTYRSDGVVESVEPGRSFSWRTVSGATASGSRTVEQLDDGRCRVVLELQVEPKPSERLMVPILRRMLAKNLRGDVERLARRIDELTAAGALSDLAGSGRRSELRRSGN